jgi:hypothetical protein
MTQEEHICKNPLCRREFESKGEKFCPECDRNLSACEKWNMDFAERHDLEPRHVLGHIMNGGA